MNPPTDAQLAALREQLTHVLANLGDAAGLIATVAEVVRNPSPNAAQDRETIDDALTEAAESAAFASDQLICLVGEILAIRRPEDPT